VEYEGKAKFTHQEQNIKTAVAGAAMIGGANATTAAAIADNTYNLISSQMPASQDGKATLHMPWMLNLGFKYDVNAAWDYSLEMDMVGWSVYRNLVIDFADNKPKDKQVITKDWENTYVFRFGSSYDFSKSFVGRLGLMYDWNPVPDATFDGQLPDSNRLGYSLGIGYKIGVIQLDASYMRLKFSSREKNNGVGFSKDTTGDGIIDQFDVPAGYPVGNGAYENFANLFSISARYTF
jgi:long-chain fatty acid transport protein